MSLSITDLTRPLSSEEVLETWLSALETLSVPARSWRKGGALRTIMKVAATTYAGFTTLAVQAIKGGFNETAAGGWLTLLGRYVYGNERLAATFATGELEFVNSGGGIFSFAIGEVRAINAITEKAYTNSEAFTLSPGETKLVAIEAVEEGSDSNAGVGDIDTLETTLLGVTVTNPEAIVGNDAEEDADLQARNTNKLGTLSNGGPRNAYKYAVSIATRPDGSPVNINRTTVSPYSSTGRVDIYVAAPSGLPDALDVTYVADSVDEVARPDAVTATVYAATEVPVTRSLILWCRQVSGGASASAIAEAATEPLVDAIASYPIGGIATPPSSQGYLYADFIAAIAKSADANCYHVTGQGDDVALDAGEVATLAATVTVRMVTT